MSREGDYDSELELNSLDPDAPLAMAVPTSPSSTSSSPPSPQPMHPQPKWLTGRTHHHHSRPLGFLAAASSWLLRALRPRLSWRYLVCAAASLYALACVVRGVPLFASPLPGYSGPHRVGAVDVEVPLEGGPRAVSDVTFKDGGRPAFEVDTVLFTVYYPVSQTARTSHRRHYWIPKPVDLTAEGYAKLAGINNFVLRPVLTFFLWLVAGGITIPADVDAPLLDSSERLPVMVFSHGMASSRTDYTHYLGELASRGHVVAAIEHRDGSSPGSLVRSTADPSRDRRVVAFQYTELQTSPQDPAMDIVRMHTDQLAFRDVEIRETVAVLRRLHEGRGADVLAANSRGEGVHFADSWAGRLDFSQLTIGGHSYGATGALQALKGAPSASNPAVGGVILDPGKSSGPLNHDVAVPLLVVHSTSWSAQSSIFYGRPHFDTVRDLTLAVLRRARASWFLTGLGTSHPSVTDAPLLEPLLLHWTTGASANAREALHEYVRVTSDFFRFLERGDTTGVLDEEVTHDAYQHWISEDRQSTFPPELAKFWEVHVSPKGPNPEYEGKEKEQ